MASKVPIYLVSERPTHTPLGIASICSYAMKPNGSDLREHYEFTSEIQSTASALGESIRERGPGVVLVSHYVWSTDQLLALTRKIAERFPECVMIHGGPSVPKYEEACATFFERNPGVHVAVRGEGEPTVREVLERLTALRDLRGYHEVLEGVGNTTVRRPDGTVMRNADRARLTDLSTMPSPYLDGFFDARRYPWVGAILETNRGCPYGCTFCDWGSLTMQKIREFPLERVEQEIDWIGRRKIPVIFVGDANFGILERDMEIARFMAKTREKYASPKQIAIAGLAKNSHKYSQEIIKTLVRAKLVDGGLLALQTTDPTTLTTIRRSNIKTHKYLELRQVFEQEGIPVSTDLLVGLPGSTVASFKNDLQFCFDQWTHPKIFAVRVLPNSPMADPVYMKEHGVEVDPDGFVLSTNTCSAADITRMRWLSLRYAAFVAIGLLKYLLYWLQEEHGLRAVDVMEHLADVIANDPNKLPIARDILSKMGVTDIFTNAQISYRPSVVLSPWADFYEEIAAYITERYGVQRDEMFESVIAAQRAVMPSMRTRYPLDVALPHDFPAYLRNLRDPNRVKRSLASYGPTTLRVTDPHGMRWLPFNGWAKVMYGYTKIHFELPSTLMPDARVAPLLLFAPSQRNLRGLLDSVRSFATLTSEHFGRALDARDNYDLSVKGTLDYLKQISSNVT